MGTTGAMGAVGAVGAMGAKFAPRREGCSTEMGLVEGAATPAIEPGMELEMEPPRPRELMSGDCCE